MCEWAFGCTEETKIMGKVSENGPKTFQPLRLWNWSLLMLGHGALFVLAQVVSGCLWQTQNKLCCKCNMATLHVWPLCQSGSSSPSSKELYGYSALLTAAYFWGLTVIAFITTDFFSVTGNRPDMFSSRANSQNHSHTSTAIKIDPPGIRPRSYPGFDPQLRYFW